ncbi:hypothetical protein KIP69_08395 [Geobacter sulfurreducens]|uniref:hypothetical protein n=1 Tax=Geobacter sulfurreducens TaxID=35554 RepID=UPI001BDD0904|nr:hypothetical protein [Geobacter sulfurreducens]QVW36836.1 hypothetical protein KIP69_08395 [Geobacter sulfurreducens]UTG94308.1 hypothetical protein J8622_08365 [Geobacter sulfurreducens]
MKINSITAVAACLIPCFLANSMAFGGTCDFMSLTSAGGNDYIIKTNGSISNVQSIILKVGYSDENRLASKQPVSQEGTAQWTFFNSTPRSDGLLIYASTQQPLHLSGTVARIRFARVTTPPTLACTITADYVKSEKNQDTSNNSTTSGSSGNSSATVADETVKSGDSFTTQNDQGTSSNGLETSQFGATSMTVRPDVHDGGETPPPPHEEQEQPEDELQHDEEVTPTAQPELPSQPDATPPPSPSRSPEHVEYRSILSRFQAEAGERTPSALMALFSEPVAQGISQTPPIGLSDGESIVTLTLKATGDDGATPLFILKGARLLALTREPGGFWAVKTLPDRGVSEAVLTVLSGEDSVVYPLTVAPRINIKPKEGEPLTEADFTAFIAQRGGEQGQAGDLNGDGKRDYLDDYIFTANYLAATSTPLSGARTKEPSPSPAQP